jgi:hypothetical protein
MVAGLLLFTKGVCHMRVTAMVLVLGLIAVPAFAGAPTQGTYYTYDMPNGSFNTGHFSESWVDPGQHGQHGNTINAQSWDGILLGDEWKLWCPSIQTDPVLVSNTVDGNGDGEVTWRTTYTGGHFWFSDDGPWENVLEPQEYTGDLDFFTVTTTYQYVGGEILGIRSNVVSYGQFDGFTDCMEYTINNAAFFGTTDEGPKPAEFPEFLDENCGTGTWSRGGWGSVTEIALRIRGDCDVATQPSTWGQIKSLYGE